MTTNPTNAITTTVHLAVYDGLADWEAGHTTAAINGSEFQRTPGSARVVTVGESTEPVTTMGGLRIVPDLALDALSSTDSSMLLLPGATSWMTGGNGAFVAAAARFLEAGVPVAAICGATVGLAAAGLLDERPHTSNAPVVLASVGYGGAAHYVDQPAVTDGDLITASGIAPVPFARAVLARLDLFEPAVLDAWERLYGQGDPAAYEDLMAASAA
jgi:putative intracellular protease/amidase